VVEEPTAARRRRQFVLHPLLFAAFPVLYLYAHNIQEGVSLGGMLRSLGLVIGGTAILFAIGVLLLRDHRRAGLASRVWYFCSSLTGTSTPRSRGGRSPASSWDDTPF